MVAETTKHDMKPHPTVYLGVFGRTKIRPREKMRPNRFEREMNCSDVIAVL